MCNETTLTDQEIIQIIDNEVKPALGCTEPAAVALASAKATEILGTPPIKANAILSGNIIKNGMGVGVPSTGKYGLPIAIGAGIFGGKSEKELEVIKDISFKQLQQAEQFISEDRISIKEKNSDQVLYIEINLFDKDNNSAKVVIEDLHSNIVKIEKNDKVIAIKDKKNNKKSDNKTQEVNNQNKLSIERIYQFATTAPFKDIEFILTMRDLNTKIAEEGLRGNYGLQIGKSIKQDIENKILGDDLVNYATSYTTAATDARMDGASLPVMSNTGSGNQGLTISLPIIAAAQKLNKNDEKLTRALIMGNLISIHIKYYLGRLSALCGVVVAAGASSAGITYLLGGNYNQICFALKNVTASISGMICDGAKPGCSLKVAAAVSTAVHTALLAMKNIEVSSNDGIIDEDIEKTLKNLALIGKEGMKNTDKMILNIMTSKCN